jgi:predicted DCC family thiol-disulfide oxidoreductase YuxK
MSWQKAPLTREPFGYRSDPSVPAFSDDHPIIIFDGKCVLCSSFAQLILRQDRKRDFRLLAAQTAIGGALYAHFGLDPVAQETIILLEDGRAWFKSEAAIRICGRLGFPWSLVRVASWLPEALRDWLYDIVARNRFNWFGRRTSCYLPDASEADRFIA